MYDFEEMDRQELEQKNIREKKMSFFQKLAYFWLGLSLVCR